ncbi:MAG: response regulator transcription factor [Candidatus Omnitrophica bacterium]|nr:response regulator transcription factor [Candidatus Omnitrophota bacterium]
MRVLVVEDERKIAGFIARGLKEEGYAVDLASDGEEGHFLVSTNEYDLLILDLMLPKTDGLSLCRRLRREGYTAAIIMLTARDTVRDKVTGLDAGADDYVTKPFAFEELLARIRALLRVRGRAGTQATRLEAGDLVMDLVSHEVRRAGKPVNLTAKEFSLLEYFMRHAGSVVTRTMIAEHVWDINFDTDTNVIDVYVSHLRDKIDRSFKKKLIHTLRGRGYMLDAS